MLMRNDAKPMAEANKRMDNDLSAAELAERRIALLEKEVRQLRSDIDALHCLERYRDIILSRHQAQEGSTYSKSVRVLAEEFLEEGSGFHPLEYGSDGAPYRWAGPEPEAVLSVWVDRSVELVLRLCSHTSGRCANLTVMVDEHVFVVTPRCIVDAGAGKVVVSVGPIPPRARLGPTDIRLRPERLFSPSEDGEKDTRLLGFTLIWLDLEPVVE